MGRQINTMYYFIRFFVRQALTLYCRRITVNDDSYLELKGPLLLASNHPNAFFDALILASRMRQPLYFLALGELTDKWMARWLLKILHIIPVYQLQDNRPNQERNYQSFARCVEVLSSGGIILVFSEGICENNWRLRPFKKWTARVVLEALEHPQLQSVLRVLPVGLNYNSYKSPGNTIFIQYGPPISINELQKGTPEAEKIHEFNELLRDSISALMLQTGDKTGEIQMVLSNIPNLQNGEIKITPDAPDIDTTHNLLEKLKKPGYLVCSENPFGQTLFYVLVLGIPALLGWTGHLLFYYPLKYFVRIKTAGTVFYDSVLFMVLFLLYPFYWMAVNISGYFIFRNPSVQVILICLPLLGYATLHWQVNAQRLRNYYAISKQERKILRDYFS